jgi:TolB-like protein/class 3 adenylate cyclase/Tfp pilus assembly protein PilF
MVGDEVERRLAAILAADVVGYSRLMEIDEVGTLSALKARRRDIFNPVISRYKGRLVKLMGDGALVEFSSAVAAVQCAIDLQAAFAKANQGIPPDRHIALRIGINLGDVLIEGRDIYGDGVNIAARLESVAEPGGICISQSVHDQVHKKLDIAFENLGSQAMKNIAEPVVAYRIRRGDDGPSGEALPLPAKPSIAVLPFTSMSGEAEQETFADGLTEDLITDLSRNDGLFVIARNSTFAYKGKSVDARRIARELGVRYLLEGSARRAADRVRINVQLIDAIGGGHLWAERFDRGLEDVFAVQDEVTARIVGALVGKLSAPPPRSRPKNMEAFDLCARGRHLHELSPIAAREGFLLLERAIAIDPDYAEAHAWLALSHWIGWVHWGWPEAHHRRRAVEIAGRAVELDPNAACCRWIQGMLLAYESRWEESDAAFATALKLDPNHADAWAELSDISVLAGRIADGLAQAKKALRLNPHPPGWYYLLLGQAQYAAKDYAAAIETLRHESTYRTGSRRQLAAALAMTGRMEEAKYEADMFMLSNPHFTTNHWLRTQPLRDEGVKAHFREGYLKAGLPE